jgi:hypothetical protein
MTGIRNRGRWPALPGFGPCPMDRRAVGSQPAVGTAQGVISRLGIPRQAGQDSAEYWAGALSATPNPGLQASIARSPNTRV